MSVLAFGGPPIHPIVVAKRRLAKASSGIPTMRSTICAFFGMRSLDSFFFGVSIAAFSPGPCPRGIFEPGGTCISGFFVAGLPRPSP